MVMRRVFIKENMELQEVGTVQCTKNCGVYASCRLLVVGCIYRCLEFGLMGIAVCYMCVSIWNFQM